jgi:hypothetical protein
MNIGLETLAVTKLPKQRSARTRTVSTRVTETEYVALQEQAWSTGKTVCDWVRECIAQQLKKGSTTKLEEYLFTELVGIQLLLMNTLGPLLRGERMPAEAVEAVIRQVQARKTGKAQELLNKRLSLELEIRGGTPKQSAGTSTP